jgi:hypothetical protein
VDTVRRLSDVEATFAYTHALMHGTTQVTTHFTVSGEFDPARTARAAERWSRESPILSLRIEDRADGLWFRTGPRPRPEQIRHSVLSAPASATDLLSEELNDVIASGSWLWRLHIVGDPDAAATHFYFTRNHAISDGHSTAALVRAFLDVLLTEPADDQAHTGRVDSLAPNGDELTYRPPEPPDTPHREPVTRPDPVPFVAHRQWVERVADFVPLTLTEPESLALKDWCRGHRITVNQFFAAALAESFAQATGRSEISVFTAVSLRQRYRPSAPLPDVGCFINVVNAPLALDRGDLAEHARAYAASFRRADANWQPPRRDHATIRRAVEEAATATASPGICITNLGIVDPALGPHASRVTGYRTVVNRTGGNYSVVLHLAMFKGAFGMQLAFGSPGTDRGTVQHVAKGLRDRTVVHADADA